MISDDRLKAARQEAPPPQWTEDEATGPQIGYIKGLVESRQIPEDVLLRIQADVKAGLKKGRAGEIIGELKGMPLKPQQDDRSKNRPTIKDLPVGRYAIPSAVDDDDIKFYRVKDVRGGPEKHGGYRFIAQIAGPNQYPLRQTEAKEAVKRIIRFGIGNAAALYGNKIGRCSKCHIRITNRISRRLGIGPVCGGHYYEDWEKRVNTARTALISEGLDPNENVEGETA